MSPSPNVLVLGAGINGAAVARELALNGVAVTVVDTADIASGTTAYSSRLIHGGLRYLEHGEFDLVRESLAERTRLLRLAPQFVRPLRLFVPIAQGRRLAGLGTAIRRFLGGAPRSGAAPARGLWLVRTGLWLYDRYARDPQLPRHAMLRVGDAQSPPVDAARYGWLGAYSDAQILFPERFVLSMLLDARQLAAEQDRPFRVWTYSRATLSPDRQIEVRCLADNAVSDRFPVAAVVNASGPWIDHALRTLPVRQQRLIGGTKGSHFLTRHAGLRDALQGSGVYAEASDGRPVFLLPFGPFSLVGTTDLPFDGDPATATADAAEIDYLRRAVAAVFPSITLAPDDVDLHYCGVRPLPYVGDGSRNPGAITRRHQIVETDAAVPLFSAVGGKLTTCRSFAEEIAGRVLRRLELPVRGSSRERVFPGGEAYPADAESLAMTQRQLARDGGVDERTVAAVWQLVGTRAGQFLRPGATADAPNCLPGTHLPHSVVRQLLREEWVTRLEDLVERRLMLLYEPSLSATTLRALGMLMADERRLDPATIDDEVARCVERLARHYGKRL